jgi:hypothetical protein
MLFVTVSSYEATYRDVAMDVSPTLAPLVEPSKVVVRSDAQLAERVRIKAKEHPEYGASKAVVEIPEMYGAECTKWARHQP